MDDARETIREFVSQIRKNEPHTLVYQSLTDSKDPTWFCHYMVFEDLAAFKQHESSSYRTVFTDALYPCCSEMPVPHYVDVFDEVRN